MLKLRKVLPALGLSAIISTQALPLAVSGASAAPAASGSASAITYPIKTSNTYTYFTGLGAEAAKVVNSYNEAEVYIELQKRTGVKLKFIHPPANQVNESYNLMVASGDIPDITQSGGETPVQYKGGLWKGVADKAYLDLTNLIPKNAPDYNRVLNMSDRIKRDATSDDGKIAAFYKIKTDPDPTFLRLIVRRDALEQVGAKIPQYKNELEALLAKFKSAGYTPLVVAASPNNEQHLMSMYDLAPGFTVKEGKVVYSYTEPGFKQFVQMMADWYKKDYISKDFASLTGAQKSSLIDTKKVAMQSDAGGVVAQFNRAKGQGYVLDSMPIPKLREGQKIHTLPGITYVAAETAISTKAKNPETIVQMFNYLYTPEGSELANWGIENVSFKKVNGKNVYTDNVLKNPKMSITAAGTLLRMHVIPKLSLKDVECHPDVIADAAGLEIRMRYSDDPDVDNAYVLPNVSYTTKEVNDRTAIMNDVETYVNEMYLQFVTGATSMDKYDDYIKNVKGMRIDDAVKITQAAYDRWSKK